MLIFLLQPPLPIQLILALKCHNDVFSLFTRQLDLLAHLKVHLVSVRGELTRESVVDGGNLLRDEGACIFTLFFGYVAGGALFQLVVAG